MPRSPTREPHDPDQPDPVRTPTRDPIDPPVEEPKDPDPPSVNDPPAPGFEDPPAPVRERQAMIADAAAVDAPALGAFSAATLLLTGILTPER